MTVNIKNWQELKKPNALEVKPGHDPKRRAVFVAEPLERGFGSAAVLFVEGSGRSRQNITPRGRL